MNRPYIERLHIQSYGCVRDATLALTPLHALIGPNDSGKSTILRALRTMSLLAAASGPDLASDEARTLRGALFSGVNDTTLEASSTSRSWKVQVLRKTELYEKSFSGALDTGDTGNTRAMEFGAGSQRVFADTELRLALTGSQMLRLDPDALRAPSGLIADGNALRLSNERGNGLPACRRSS